MLDCDISNNTELNEIGDAESLNKHVRNTKDGCAVFFGGSGHRREHAVGTEHGAVGSECETQEDESFIDQAVDLSAHGYQNSRCRN